MHTHRPPEHTHPAHRKPAPTYACTGLPAHPNVLDTKVGVHHVVPGQAGVVALAGLAPALGPSRSVPPLLSPLRGVLETLHLHGTHKKRSDMRQTKKKRERRGGWREAATDSDGDLPVVGRSVCRARKKRHVCVCVAPVYMDTTA